MPRLISLFFLGLPSPATLASPLLHPATPLSTAADSTSFFANDTATCRFDPNFPPSALGHPAAVTVPQGSADGACQAHFIPIVLGWESWDRLTYDDCVAHFQSITINCMLIAEGRSAKEGFQAGVRNILNITAGEDGLARNSKFKALDGIGPGYTVGPPGYFGNVSAVGLSDKVIENA